MVTRIHSTLLIAVVLVSGCNRGAPAAGSQGANTPPPDTVQPVAPAPPPDTVQPVAPAPKPDKVHPVAPAPPPEKVHPVAPAPPTTASTGDSNPPLRDAYHTAPLDTVDARTYQGWKYFNLNCARCHGEDVAGTTIAPHLILSLKPDGPIPDEATFLTTVCGGRPEKGMPAWCALGMTPGEIDTIYAYVHGRSAGQLHPGRPARRGG